LELGKGKKMVNEDKKKKRVGEGKGREGAIKKGGERAKKCLSKGQLYFPPFAFLFYFFMPFFL